MSLSLNLKSTCAAAAAAMCFGLPATAATVDLALDGDIVEFFFDDVAWDDEFTVDISEPAFLVVTDLFISGDIFEVFVDDVSVGLTSDVPSDAGLSVGVDFEAAVLDPNFSSGVFALGAGTFTITGLVEQSADGFTGGSAAIALSSTDPTAPIPLPASGFLLLAGLGAGTYVARRKGRASRD